MSWLNKISLRTKILTAFAITSAGFVWIALNGISGIAQMNANVEDLYTNSLVSVKYALSANVNASNHFRNVYRYGLIDAPATRKDSIEQMDRFDKALTESIEAYRKTPLSEEEKAQLKIYDDAMPTYKKYVAEIMKLYDDGKRAEANDYMVKTLRPQFRFVEDSLAAIAVINDKGGHDNYDNSGKMYQEIRKSSLIFLGAMVLFAILIGLFLASNLNQLIRAISNIAERLGTASETVASAATEISATSQSLSESTTEQASALEETASSLEEMSAMISKNSDNSKQSADTSNAGLSQVEQGRKIVEEMIHSMQEIESSNSQIEIQVTDSNRQLSTIIAMINEISSKTKVINDIVFQTKLLSFNASVEAARAGENGKGFAVVAEEVGNLAQMSGNAAKEISQLLEQSTGEVQKIVSDTQSKVGGLVERAKGNVARGATTAQDCAKVFTDIHGKVGDVTRMAGEISTASEEQSRGIQQINTAMGQLNQVTQQTAASSGEVATAANELSNQSESLKTLVSDLVRTVTGKNDGVEMKSSSSQARKNVVSIQSARKAFVPKKAAAAKAEVAAKKASGDATPGRDDDRFEDL